MKNMRKISMKGLIAMITLTAMTMTGATVPALAAELVEEATDQAVVDCFPEDEEIMACAIEEVVCEEGFELGEDGLIEIFTAEGESETVEEIGEVEELNDISLGELTGEEEAFEEEPENRQQLMAALIDMAVEEHQAEGVYAALNSTFATLADNADILANPETGVIETDGDEIVNMTYNALKANFNNTPEQLMGAIGAATLRADNAGYIQAIGGDATLIAMAASESDAKMESTMKAYFKATYEASLEGAAIACPALKPYIPLIKALCNNLFSSSSSNTNAEIKAQLAKIEKQLAQSEQNIRNSLYNVVSLANIGNKYGTVMDKAETIRTNIGDIQRDTDKTDAQKLQELADLLKSSEFQALESAMNGATHCFYSQDNDMFERQNIFEAAYYRACESVMFSREALDISMPYITRQFVYYSAAYSTMEQVYSAYEEVYGAHSLMESREKMTVRLTGLNLDGEKVDKSVPELITEYTKRDKYIFVNMSNSSGIKLYNEIFAVNLGSQSKSLSEIENAMKSMPLNQTQIEAIVKYASEKKKTIVEYLFNDMQFSPRNAVKGNRHEKYVESDFSRTSREVLDDGTVVEKWVVWDQSPNPVLLNGNQSYDREHQYQYRSGYRYYKRAKVYNATKVGAGSELIRLYSETSGKWENVTLIMFQSR